MKYINQVPLYETLTDDKFIECFNKSNSYTDLYLNIGYSSAKSVKPSKILGIKERIKFLGLDESRLRKRRSIKTNKNNICLNCGKQTNNVYFCSYNCNREYNKKLKIKHWKETGDTGCGVSSTLRNCIRDYILEAQQNKCAICGIDNKWNNKPLNFILDHIDGDASNNKEENLRLICPNCDSQLDTYKSKNKNSARTFRKK